VREYFDFLSKYDIIKENIKYMVKFLFLTVLILTIVSSFIIIKTTEKLHTPEIFPETKKNNDNPENNEDKPPEKSEKKKFFKFLPINAGTVFIGSGVLLAFILSLIDTPFRSVSVLITIALICEYIFMCFYYVHGKKFFKFCAETIVVLSVLEATIFNAPSYHIWFGDYQQKTLNFSDCSVEIGEADIDGEKNTVHIHGKNEVVLTFPELDTKIGTIHADIEYMKKTEHVKTVIDVSDETHMDYRYDIASTDIIKEQESSAYIPCEFSGKVQKFRIKFTGYKDGDEFIVKSVTLNKEIPFEISWLRIGIIGILSVLAYSICSLEAFKAPFKEKKRLCGLSFYLVTILCCLLTALIINKELGDSTTIKDHLKLKYGNQITQELVDAFEKGQVSLLDEPDEGIEEMENPYDWSQRNQTGLNFAWDHVYYNGKYYSYYGIAPVILLYMPYHLITGYYCSTNLSIMLFSIIGMVFLTMAYSQFLKKWFRDTPAGIAIAGHIIIMVSNGIWYSVGRNIFYEISISSGFMFVAMGVYFLLSSNVVGEGRISVVRTFLSSLFLAMAVLCRPTLAVYCICACIYFAYGFFKKDNIVLEGSEAASKPVKKSLFLICAVVPFVILGGFQMWYNYVRFGSPLDFGIQYSLTINDFTHSQYHTIFVLIGLFNYIFAPPEFSPEYPFITTPFSKFEANGYYFSDVGNTSGIIFLAFPVLAYLLSKKALDRLPDRKSRIKSILLVGLPCIIMPFVIICSIWESGYAVRYTADFSWQIIIGAYAVLFYLYSKTKNETKKDFVRKFMAVSMICAVVINSIQIFNFTFPEGDYPALCYSLEKMIAFWK